MPIVAASLMKIAPYACKVMLELAQATIWQIFMPNHPPAVEVKFPLKGRMSISMQQAIGFFVKGVSGIKRATPL